MTPDKLPETPMLMSWGDENQNFLCKKRKSVESGIDVMRELQT